MPLSPPTRAVWLVTAAFGLACTRPTAPTRSPAERATLLPERTIETPAEAARATAPLPTAPATADIAPPSASAAALSIFAVDIGQGDATVVLGPNLDGRRRALVMDAGDRAPKGGRIVEELLTREGIAELDWVVLSHFDADHLGGFVTVSGSTSLLWQDANCDPKPLFPKVAIFDQGTDTNQSQSSAEWKRCVPRACVATGTEHVHVQGGSELGRVLDLGGGATATIVAGDGFVIDRPSRVPRVNTPNERSIALLVSHPDGFDFLVTGDLIGQTAGAEDAAVEGALGAALKTRGIDVEVLRIGHHGAANASEIGFLRAITPEVAIISTGDNQKANYKHPRCITYQSLKDAAVGLVVQTERGKTDCSGPTPLTPEVVNGSIRIDVVGSTYSVASYGTTSANGVTTASFARTCTLAQGCGASSPSPIAAACCRTCTQGLPCGDSCIPVGHQCTRPAGCACSAQ